MVNNEYRVLTGLTPNQVIETSLTVKQKATAIIGSIFAATLFSESTALQLMYAVSFDIIILMVICVLFFVGKKT